MTNILLAQSYALLLICINYIINHMLNLIVGPTSIDVKFENISLEGMKFILN